MKNPALYDAASMAPFAPITPDDLTGALLPAARMISPEPYDAIPFVLTQSERSKVARFQAIIIGNVRTKNRLDAARAIPDAVRKLMEEV